MNVHGLNNLFSEVFQTIIVAPHPDDEIIGAFKYLSDPTKSITVIYSGNTDLARREEALGLKEHAPTIKAQLFQLNIPTVFLDRKNTFLFPDPIYETHPDHRIWGMQGEQLARNGFDVIFYTINMLAPYIYELSETERKQKEELLNKVYPSQKSLWSADYKYFLFEGRCKWIF